ncbi:MAG: phosphatase PAP2 family protein [Planctomycetaceae bacterium]|nr:phosphatase PAP2 family protein [Planctomycetaceae bacterium]
MHTSLRLFLIGLMAFSGWATGCQAPRSYQSQETPASVSRNPGGEGIGWGYGSQTPRLREPAENSAYSYRAVQPASNVEPAHVGAEHPSSGCSSSVESCGSQAAVPDCFGPRDVFREDRRDFFPMLWRDTKGLVNWHDMALTGAALGGALAVRQDIDFEVRHYVEEHPQRWSHSSKMLGYVGEVQYQVPVLLGVYGYSVYTEDEELHELSKAILSAYSITGVTTLSIKAIADTERPSQEWNDGQFGFPSFHTSSSFSVAAVVEEYCGLPTALPVYALSGLIGWSRIDEQDHDLSDVIFGAALGYIIGKSVARQHKDRHSNMRLGPYQHPLEPAGGIAAEWRY